MRKLTAAIVLAFAITVVGCGNSDNVTEDASEVSTSEIATAADTEYAVEAQEDTVTITIPSQYESISTQEEADEIAEKNGYESAVLEEDGSLTIVMTSSVHDDLMNQFVRVARGGMDELIGSQQYPNITDIIVNEDYSIFTVTTESEIISEDENYSGMELVMYGMLYHIYSGNDVDNIHVDYVNATSGEIIDTLDSGSLVALFEQSSAIGATEESAVEATAETMIEQLTTEESAQESEE